MFDSPVFLPSCKRTILVRKRRASQAALRKAPGREEEKVGRAEAEGRAEEGCCGGKAKAETRGGQSKVPPWEMGGRRIYGRNAADSL